MVISLLVRVTGTEISLGNVISMPESPNCASTTLNLKVYMQVSPTFRLAGVAVAVFMSPG